jgi:hypothetical protein
MGGVARYLGHRNLQSKVTLHCVSAGSVREVLEGLKPGDPYRYGNTSVSPGGTKSMDFSCPKGDAVTISYRWLIIVSVAHSWRGKQCLEF